MGNQELDHTQIPLRNIIDEVRTVFRSLFKVNVDYFTFKVVFSLDQAFIAPRMEVGVRAMYCGWPDGRIQWVMECDDEYRAVAAMVFGNDCYLFKTWDICLLGNHEQVVGDIAELAKKTAHVCDIMETCNAMIEAAGHE